MTSQNSVVYYPDKSLSTWKLLGDSEQFLCCFSNKIEPRETEKLFSYQLKLIVILEKSPLKGWLSSAYFFGWFLSEMNWLLEVPSVGDRERVRNWDLTEVVWSPVTLFELNILLGCSGRCERALLMKLRRTEVTIFWSIFYQVRHFTYVASFYLHTTGSQMRNLKMKNLRSPSGVTNWKVVRTTWELREQFPLFRTLDKAQDRALPSAPRNCLHLTPSRGKVCKKRCCSRNTSLETEVPQ